MRGCHRLDELSTGLRKLVNRRAFCDRLTFKDIGPSSPTLRMNLKVVGLPRKLDEVEALLLVLKILAKNSEELRAVEIFVTEEVIQLWRKRLSRNDRLQFDIYSLLDYDVIVTWLYLNDEISSQSFFGNFIPRGLEALSRIRLRYLEPPPPKEQVYRRGYRDQGYLRPFCQRLYDTGDWSQRDLHLELERIKEQYSEYWKQLILVLEEQMKLLHRKESTAPVEGTELRNEPLRE